MKFLELRKYWEDAARSNRMLRHESAKGYSAFKVMDIEEIVTGLSLDMSGMVLIMENPEIRPQDSLSDNPRKNIKGAVLVVQQFEKGNFPDRDKKIDECETVCEQLMAKLFNDYRKYKDSRNHPYRIEAFDLNSIGMQKVGNLFGGYWIGWRMEYAINNTFANGLILKDEDWYHDKAWTL